MEIKTLRDLISGECTDEAVAARQAELEGLRTKLASLKEQEKKVRVWPCPPCVLLRPVRVLLSLSSSTTIAAACPEHGHALTQVQEQIELEAEQHRQKRKAPPAVGGAGEPNSKLQVGWFVLIAWQHCVNDIGIPPGSRTRNATQRLQTELSELEEKKRRRDAGENEEEEAQAAVAEGEAVAAAEEPESGPGPTAESLAAQLGALLRALTSASSSQVEEMQQVLASLAKGAGVDAGKWPANDENGPVQRLVGLGLVAVEGGTVSLVA